MLEDNSKSRSNLKLWIKSQQISSLKISEAITRRNLLLFGKSPNGLDPTPPFLESFEELFFKDLILDKLKFLNFGDIHFSMFPVLGLPGCVDLENIFNFRPLMTLMLLVRITISTVEMTLMPIM